MLVKRSASQANALRPNSDLSEILGGRDRTLRRFPLSLAWVCWPLCLASTCGHRSIAEFRFAWRQPSRTLHSNSLFAGALTRWNTTLLANTGGLDAWEGAGQCQGDFSYWSGWNSFGLLSLPIWHIAQHPAIHLDGQQYQDLLSLRTHSIALELSRPYKAHTWHELPWEWWSGLLCTCEATVGFVNWNAVAGNSGDALLHEGCESCPFRFMEILTFLACAAYYWECNS